MDLSEKPPYGCTEAKVPLQLVVLVAVEDYLTITVSAHILQFVEDGVVLHEVNMKI